MQVPIIIWILCIIGIIAIVSVLLAALVSADKLGELQLFLCLSIIVICMAGFLVPMGQMNSENDQKIYIKIENEKGELIIRKPFYVVVDWSRDIKRTTALHPEKSEIEVPITSKDGNTYNIFIKVHQFYVEGHEDREKENKQFAEKVKEATMKNTKEKVQEEQLMKMIQEEVKQYTSEELNSKLFLSKQLQEVEKKYNKKHFLQVKLFT